VVFLDFPSLSAHEKQEFIKKMTQRYVGSSNAGLRLWGIAVAFSFSLSIFQAVCKIDKIMKPQMQSIMIFIELVAPDRPFVRK